MTNTEELTNTAIEIWKAFCDKKYTIKEALIILNTLETLINKKFDSEINS